MKGKDFSSKDPVWVDDEEAFQDTVEDALLEPSRVNGIRLLFQI